MECACAESFSSCKKNLTNCGIALLYLRQAGLNLYDQDGTEIIEDDVTNGDKELVLSLLWNVFVHLQLPLLINKSIFEEEICKFNETREVSLLLLKWMKELERIFYGNIVAYDAAMLLEATKDELQNVNFICAANLYDFKCDMELLNASRKTMAMMLGGIMQSHFWVVDAKVDLTFALIFPHPVMMVTVDCEEIGNEKYSNFVAHEATEESIILDS